MKGSFIERQTLAVDGSGSVYVAGVFFGQIDLDPGPGTSLRDASAPLNRTPFLVKLTSSGEFVWGLTFQDCAFSIVDAEIDGSGTLWLGGGFVETCDLDPGAGSAPVTAIGSMDSAVVRLSASTGAYLGSRTLSLDTHENVSSIAQDSDGSLYFAGSFTSNFPSTAFLLKTDASGAELWLKNFECFDAFSIAPTPGGGVVTAGVGRRRPGPFSEGLLLTKIDREGNLAWTIDIPGRGALATDVASTALGFVAVGLQSTFSFDIDPGSGTTLLTEQGAFTTRYAF